MFPKRTVFPFFGIWSRRKWWVTAIRIDQPILVMDEIISILENDQFGTADMLYRLIRLFSQFEVAIIYDIRLMSFHPANTL
ncbi:hypothetical protein LEP1GSC050_4142 [Leptospira broomii serovar Hurstbridge str. 5399]|uniref:Uncharacterized protein n=1 Tax=Leptospira broomii serovar Hurstbridge str. 5399 TaxID=1049789 RepID=T0F8K5_9LEPT|nr:hypothetical protein LEP1GSC050_4142 [Leptospira broomii serovar Hurstbridge str. 5399]